MSGEQAAEPGTRKYGFSWALLGDLEAGRPNLGPTTRVEVYRLMQFCFRDVLEQHVGTEATDEIFREAGRLAGRHFAARLLPPTNDLSEFAAALQRTLRDLGVGVLRVEQADVDRGSFVITVSEDLDCSGLPEIDDEVCVYDEGFIASLLESFFGQPFTVDEVDCWCTGDRTCRFTARAIGP